MTAISSTMSMGMANSSWRAAERHLDLLRRLSRDDFIRPTLLTSGNAGQVDLSKVTRLLGRDFTWAGDALYQQSSMSPDVRWEIPQTIDTINPLSSHYNPKSAYAKTLARDGINWGGVPTRPEANVVDRLAHDNSRMDCRICHTSWATSCFGCHLPMKANQRVAQNKFEGVTDRNFYHL
mgnify:CR=1 FL=1